MLIEPVKTRLELLPDYAGLVEEALEFDAVFREPTRLQGTLRAFVIPLGMNAKPQMRATGVHHQETQHFIGVGLALRSQGDVTGRKLSVEIETREAEIINQLAGWQPAGFKSVMDFTRSRLRDMRDGVAFHEIQFSIEHYIRKVLS